VTEQPDAAVPIEVDSHPQRQGPCRILLTNDDGIAAPGLRGLASALASDFEVVVVAPADDLSGAGTGIGRYDAAPPNRVRRVELDGVEAYALDGPPGLAVMAAALGAFGRRPDLVVSGPNAGLNTGTSIIHSGTVGAALTGHTFGSSGLAISLAPGGRWYWETTVPIARAATAWVAARPQVTTLNINVPAAPPEEVRGARWARIDDFGHFRVATKGEHGEQLELEVHDRRSGADPSSDTALCLAGYVTLTVLTPLGRGQVPDEDPEGVIGLASLRRDRSPVPPQAGVDVNPTTPSG
jgi:5'-nucleotidase